MDQRPDLSAVGSIATSWLAALAGVPAAAIIAAAGQGLGTVVVGGQWIGICLPWDRQVWALVNQPTMSFAASVAATGYWLGHWLGPLAVATVVVVLSKRLRSLSGHLVVLGLGWTALVLGAGWLTLIDGPDGQLARWLVFRGLPVELRWTSIAVSIAAAIPIVLRLLAIDRVIRFHPARGRRIGIVVLHLWPVPVTTIILAIVVAGEAPVEACIGAAAPLLAALVTAWFGFPPPPTHTIARVAPRTPILLAVGAVVLGGAAAAAGRPLADGRHAAIQWWYDSPTNNIRSWMAPTMAPWVSGGSSAFEESPPAPG